jgi:hypothetical protein
MQRQEFEQAWSAGRIVDFAHGTLDAEVIRAFCIARRAGDPRGVQIVNAVVSGQLDLAGVELPVPLRFRECEFEGAPILHGASISALSITNCRVPGILANGLRVERDLDISSSTVTGRHRTTASTSKTSAVWLCESQIGGRLLCVDTVIHADGDRALQADRMRVGGAVRMLRHFEAIGEVRLIGAQLHGSLDFTGVRVRAHRNLALDLSDIFIGGSLFLVTDEATGRVPIIDGRIDMRSGRISGQLLVRGARLKHSADQAVSGYDTGGPDLALSAARLFVGGVASVERGTEIDGGLDLSSGELSGLTIEAGCRITAPGRIALDLTHAELRSSLELGGVAVRGTIRLTGARVGGKVGMNEIALSDPDGDVLVKASSVNVAGDVILENARCKDGELEFQRAAIDGSFQAAGASLSNPSGATVILHQATVRGSVRLVDGFESTGYVLLNRSVIEGQLDCGGGVFVCPAPSRRNLKSHAIQGVSTTARGGMDLRWARVSPSVDLTDATTTVLMDHPQSWPVRISVSGFSYDRFEADAWNWKDRRDWLGRQADYDASPYEQAAKVFKQHGYAYGAEQILIAQRIQARKRLGNRRLRRGADAVLGWTVGYGYRPSRVVWLLVLLLTLVSLTLLTPMAQSTMRATSEAGEVFSPNGSVTGPQQSDPCGNGRVRCFHPILYAIDTVVPLVSLDQRTTWYPNPHAPGGLFVMWLLHISTIAGWALSTIFLLAFTRLTRSI